MISIIYHAREQELQLQLGTRDPGPGTRDPVDNLHPEQLVEKKANNNDVKNK